MTGRNDPWAALETPATARTLSARLTHKDSRWPLFWAVDARGQRLLTLHLSAAVSPPTGLPRFRGMTMEHRRPGGGEPDFLVLQLLQSEYSEVFQEFCADLVRVTNRATTEDAAVRKFVGRAWTWQRFLATGRSGRLSHTDQMGLLGELNILGEFLLPLLGAPRAVSAWTGPLGAAQDFTIPPSAMEAKARGVASSVRISSEHQLAADAPDRLYLGVVEVTRSSADDAITVTSYAKTLRDAFADAGPTPARDFGERLRAAGLDWAEDYADTTWRIGDRLWYSVAPGFPRLTPGVLPGGVHSVRYSLSLESCSDFAVTEDTVRQAFSPSEHP